MVFVILHLYVLFVIWDYWNASHQGLQIVCVSFLLMSIPNNGEMNWLTILFQQALSGVDASLQADNNIIQNAALQSALNTQFLVQIGIFTAVPMIMNLILEQGILRVRHPFTFSSISFPRFCPNWACGSGK